MNASSCHDWSDFLQLVHAGVWPEALELAQNRTAACGEREHVQWSCAMACCLMNLGCHEEAIQACNSASDKALADSSLTCWLAYARVLHVQILLALDQCEQALVLAKRVAEVFPGHAPNLALLGQALVRSEGDWLSASEVWSPLRDDPSYRDFVAWQDIQRHLYQGPLQPQKLTFLLKKFAETHLSVSPKIHTGATHAQPVVRQRLRLGLISPLLCASPVYFLCIGALRELAGTFDLIFFSRKIHADWANAEFKTIAAQWHEIGHLSYDALENLLASSSLHAVVDLAGWMDLPVLRALARRPIPRQYKWVGGQSATTGLVAFDGFISDPLQTPVALSALYTEPLVLLSGGYVTYSAPSYMPALRTRSMDQNLHIVGIVSHPMKLSGAFLAYLATHIRRLVTDSSHNFSPVQLRFVGWRYAQPRVQQRLLSALGLLSADGPGVQVRFIATHDHRHHLEAVADLDWIVDTFPYTCGVTALEALALGVPLRTYAGSHFAQRHGYSHARYAGLSEDEIDLERLGPFSPGTLCNTGRSLLIDSSPRLDHCRLAQDLERIFITNIGV